MFKIYLSTFSSGDYGRLLVYAVLDCECEGGRVVAVPQLQQLRAVLQLLLRQEVGRLLIQARSQGQGWSQGLGRESGTREGVRDK